MFKIVIIDDEYLVTQGIKSLINWEEIGIQIAGVAQNGIAGLQIIKSQRPDIVMTDIRMPGIDGITLIEKAKQIIPDSAFIILSGYHEYEYAKAAISLGVIDYLEKPISQEKVEQILIKAKKILNFRKKSKTVFLKDQSLQAEFLIYSLINGNKTSEESLYQVLKEQNIDLYMINEVQVCSGKYEEMPENPADSYKRIEDNLSQVMEKCNHQYFFLKENTNFTIVVFNSSNPDCTEKIGTSLKEFFDVCKKDNIEISLGMGQSYPYLINAYHSYIESKKALRYSQFTGGSDLIDIKDIEYNSSIPTVLKLNEDSIVYNIRTGNKIQVISQVKDFMSILQSHNISPEIFCHECLKLVYLVIKIAAETGKNYESKLGVDFVPHVEIQSKKSYTEICEWVINTIEDILDWISLCKNSSGHKSIARIKEYLEVNFSKDISLTELSDLVNMNANYLSILFKEETGLTYLKYLTQIRMEHARLLLSKNYKIQQVSEAVGYYNYRHFSQLFKRYVGVMPHEYKGNSKNSTKTEK